MKTAGNKSVQVYASTDINTEEPTCLVSVNGDVNVLESVVLKKRKNHNDLKNAIRRRRHHDKKNQSDKKPHNSLSGGNLNEISKKELSAVEVDVKHSVSNCESSQIFPDGANDFKTEIKEEIHSVDDTIVPFVNVSIKVEPGEQSYSEPQHKNGESSESYFDDFLQPYSDSDDEKPLIERVEWKQRLQLELGNNSTNSMDKFKHIIESPFPVVLVERLQYSGNNSPKVNVKLESSDHVKSNGSENEPMNYAINKKSKKKHVQSENQNDLYKCSYCSKEIKTWPNFIMHEQIHQKSSKCSTCKLECSNVTNLIKHTKENLKCSRRNDLTLMCSICDNGVRYKNQAALNYHVTKHTGLRPFICDLCKKSFRSKETLRQHMERHKSIPNYNCEICGRGFPNKNHLKQHQLSHTDLKPFQCDVCHNFFKSQGN